MVSRLAYTLYTIEGGHQRKHQCLNEHSEGSADFLNCTGAYLGEIAPMASAEIVPLSKHMTPKIVASITSAKKIMIVQLIVAKYYYSWKVGEFLFYVTKPMFKPLKMSIG